jgi:hypothetical protein
MGIINFDKETQELILEKTAAFFSGGLSEAKSFLTDVIKLYRYQAIWSTIIASFFFGMSYWT